MRNSFNPPPPPGPIKATQPNELCLCAACKFHHHKCPEGCIFRPYFPLYRKHEFVIMKYIFGYTNICRMAEQVSRNRLGEFFESLIREARWRAVDPVKGCMGLLDRLEMENQELRREKEALEEMLEISRTISNAYGNDINGFVDQQHQHDGNRQKFHGNGGFHEMGSVGLSNGLQESGRSSSNNGGPAFLNRKQGEPDKMLLPPRKRMIGGRW